MAAPSPRPPADNLVKEIVTIDKFRVPKFSSKDFIESLCYRHLQTAKSSRQKEFDPKPFIRTFESSIEELVRLRKKVQRQIDDLEDEAAAMQKSHKAKSTDLNRAFKDTYKQFETLETRISDVGNTAVRIGEQLENLDKERKKSAEARELTIYFMEFNEGKTERLERLKANGGPEGRHKEAIIARRLNQIAKDVDVPGTEQARAAIEKYCEVLETDLLRNFQDAYETSDTNTMAACARILHDFNGGQSCIQAYVNQHEFFTSRISALNLDQSSSSSSAINDEILDPKLITLYEDIRNVIKREWGIISVVFPNASKVLQLFLQRIFAQSVQTLLESILRFALEKSSLTYLRLLALAHRATADLVKDISDFDTYEIKSKQQAHNTSALSPLFGDSTSNNSSASLTVTVQRCMDELFMPFTENNRYIEKESQNLQAGLENALNGFTNYYLQRKASAKKSTIFSKLSSTASTGSSSGATLKSLVPNAEDEGGLSMEIMANCLKIHGESVKRCVALSGPGERPKNVGVLFETLLEVLRTKFIEVALDSVLEDISGLDGRSEPDLRPLCIVQQVNTVVHLIQAHFQNIVVPMISTSPTAHREIVMSKNSKMSKLEEKTNLIVQKIVDASTTWTSNILSKQKKTDFRPKEDNLELTSIATQPCTQTVDYLKKVYANAIVYLDGKNLESFLTEIGVNLQNLLLEHFTKFQVSTTGGLLVTKDIAKYTDIISTFSIPLLNDRFSLMRELSNLFIVRPENLKTLLEENYLSRCDNDFLRMYLSCRLDYKSARIDVMVGSRVKEFGTSGNAATGSGSIISGGELKGSALGNGLSPRDGSVFSLS
ncbi:exocyst complex component Sec10-like protein [Paraphysoderma sedebokerense]|nr:exocyst complex component Sec10-like protein [Paraphysoderma sedebokerense]